MSSTAPFNKRPVAVDEQSPCVSRQPGKVVAVVGTALRCNQPSLQLAAIRQCGLFITSYPARVPSNRRHLRVTIGQKGRLAAAEASRIRATSASRTMVVISVGSLLHPFRCSLTVPLVIGLSLESIGSCQREAAVHAFRRTREGARQPECAGPTPRALARPQRSGACAGQSPTFDAAAYRPAARSAWESQTTAEST